MWKVPHQSFTHCLIKLETVLKFLEDSVLLLSLLGECSRAVNGMFRMGAKQWYSVFQSIQESFTVFHSVRECSRGFFFQTWRSSHVGICLAEQLYPPSCVVLCFSRVLQLLTEFLLCIAPERSWHYVVSRWRFLPVWLHSFFWFCGLPAHFLKHNLLGFNFWVWINVVGQCLSWRF